MPPDNPHLPADVLIEHQEFLRALARGLLGDASRADDAVQDAFASAIESPPRGSEGVRSWLAVVVRNHARNFLRSDARRVDRERAVARCEATEDDALERLRIQRRVLEALERLREPYRTAVFLRFAEGLPPREIARRTDSNVETVRSRVQRGLDLLRRDLDAEFGQRSTWSALLVPLALPRGAGSSSGVSVAIWMSIAAFVVLAPFVAHFAFDGTAADLASMPEVRPWSAGVAPGASVRVERRAPIDTDASNSSAFVELQGTPDAAVVRRTLVTDANGRPLQGVRIDEAAPTDALGVTRVSSRNALAFDAASDAALIVLERTIDANWTLALTLDVPAEFELDADPTDLDGAVIRLVASDGSIVAESRAHPGSRPFVRFVRAPSRSLLERDVGGDWMLRAVTADGLRRAERRVHAVRGFAGEPVRLDFTDAARLVIRVTSASGVAIDDARVEVSGFQLERALHGFAVGGLTPGAHPTLVTVPGHAPARIVIDVTVGTVEREIVLEPRDEFAVRIEARSESARSNLAFELELTNTDDSLEKRAVRVDGGHDGRASIDINDLPAGTWIATPRSGGPWPFDPASAEFTLPGIGPKFTRLDAEAPLPLVVRARDERGHPIPRVRCALLVDRNELGKRAAYALDPRIPMFEVAHGEAVALPVLASRRFHWLIEADGRTSSYGDDRDARRLDDRFEIDVELAPAWRAELWIAGRDRSGSIRAIEGARLTTVSGRELARSLADGRIVLELPYDPGQLELEHDGWRIATWEGFANGRRRAELPVHRVLLERAR